MSATPSQSFLNLPNFPLCAQCHLPMMLDRVEPGSNIAKMEAIFRCDTCRLAEHVPVGELQADDSADTA